MTFCLTRLLSTVLVSTWASFAIACEVQHTLAFEMKNGSHNVRLNGLLVHYGISKKGIIPLDQGLVDGENTVTVFYMDPFGNGAARYTLLEGCKDQTSDRTALKQITFDGEATKALRFTAAAPAPAVFPGAEVTDGTGLKEAVQALQSAARNRDVRVVLARHGPYLARLKAQGTSIRQTKAYLRQVLSKGEIAIVPSFDMQPVMGGQAWEVRAAYGVPPVSASLKTANGTKDWSSGTLWVFVNGVWSVLEP